ncbi:alpha-(1,6)-fucosyltransferase-like isoform X3 [Dreissena polymorpha]|uniref:alpha-(1,6)-fucosyltransferase-like isoform X3 n=1 Tax=Dreissena polymorpha TaxID=45954 RepID=UPI002264C153|nr:alpha-(1,6)-fucosyltransferase-like isoform X3 [Dreissena polymorpha]
MMAVFLVSTTKDHDTVGPLLSSNKMYLNPKMRHMQVVSGVLVAMLFLTVYMIMSSKCLNGLQHLAAHMGASTFQRSSKETNSQQLANPKERHEEAKGQLVYSLKNQVRGHHNTENTGGESLEHEVARREVERVSDELKMYVHAKLMQIKKLASDPILVKEVNNILEISADIHKKLKSEQSRLANTVDGAGEWRKLENLQLTDLVQRRLEFLQNPSDCDKAKQILCKLVVTECGYGCQLHHVTFCLIMAYATQRTLILKSEGWRYAPKGWESVFLPISKTCRFKSDMAASQWGPIPEDIADHLTCIHGDPAAWWVGQFVTYVTRPNAMMQKFLNEGKEKLGFTNPIVGVQVRRTDKLISEAKFHSVDEYMHHVVEWYDIYEKKHPGVQRKVYIATDDPGVLHEAKKNYPNYTFVSDNEVSKSADRGSRYTDASLRGIILDVYLLSRCNYLVCTFSSNVCRAAYELMQSLQGDASECCKSLDHTYSFEDDHLHSFIAVEDHQSQREGEISFNAGDTIRLTDNQWDVYCQGTNVKTGKSGLFPSYKTVKKIERVKMITYSEVPDS